MELREATIDDARLLFEWTNDADVHRWSWAKNPVDWETHVAWLTGVCADDSSRLFVAIDDGVPVGQVRLDAGIEGDLISVSVAPDARGRGLSSAIIRAACGYAPRVIAEIDPENERSIRAFAAAGFRVADSGPNKVTMRWP